MADPISSSSPNAPPNACIDEDSEASEASEASAVRAAPPQVASSTSQPQMSTPESNVCEAPSAVKSLVAQFPSGTPVRSPASEVQQGGSPSGVGYTFRGPTPDGDSYRVAAAFVKTPTPSGSAGGLSLEVLSVSAQDGKDKDAQATMIRANLAVSHAGYGLSITADGPSARANLGEDNDDGSIGGNIGAGASFIGAEATINTPVGSVTAGASLSASVSGSLGVRDIDHDGKPEFCAKFSIPEYTIGACLEQFW
jgi:hypothetical protein